MNAIWHDVECGAYTEDLALWRSLAEQHPGPILDVGAGTGRVALDLARRGHSVIALDNDPELLSELRSRADGLEVQTLLADARSFELARRCMLCLVPMQTIQLLGGDDGRAAFLRCSRAALEPGATLAIAISDSLEPYEVLPGTPGPLPDIRELDGVVYASQPIAVREEPDGFVLERRRETVTAAGRRSVQENRIRLDRLDSEQLEREGAAAGLAPFARAEIPATQDYVGSVVVMFRG